MKKNVGPTWQRQESRPVRPFRSAADCLGGVGFRVYSSEDFQLREAIQIASVEIDRLALAIRVPAISEDLEEVVGIPIEELRLVVTMEDRSFKNSSVALDVALSEVVAAPKIFPLAIDSVATMSWAGETRVHVAILLAAPRTGEVGTAHRVSSWVSRKTFSVGKVRDSASFAIEAVEPDYFLQRGLPATATYLVEISDSDLNQSCENLPDLVRVSLAKDVHTALARDEESPMAKALVRSIYVDVVTTVLATGYASLGPNCDVQQDSIIDVVTTRLMKSTGLSERTLRAYAEMTAGAQLRAVVQADIDLSRSLVSAAQRR